jgi:alkylation response protein AidB-like acyl-CoA dehydrogenase
VSTPVGNPSAPWPLELRLDAEQRAFRDEIRAFLADEMRTAPAHADPLDLTGCALDFEQAHLRRCGQRGYLGISVPAEHGGGGRPPSYRAIWSFEAAYADAPSIDTSVVLCSAPVLAHGSDAMRARLVPSMLRGETQGCIAYTEPGAGSDLTAIETLAVPEGDGFVLSGSKALITALHKADWCITIARTDIDAPTRDAFTMFVVPLDTPGVQCTRRATANGWTLGELRFDDVAVGADAVLGTVGHGWAQMAAALVEERSGVAWLGWATRLVEALAAWARTCRPPSRAHDAAHAVVALHTDLAIAYRLVDRVMAAQDAGRTVNADAAASKVWVTELLQRIARTALELVGVDALAWAPVIGAGEPAAPLGGRIAWEYLERIHPTISVGANELQRDAIARSAFHAAGLR